MVVHDLTLASRHSSFDGFGFYLQASDHNCQLGNLTMTKKIKVPSKTIYLPAPPVPPLSHDPPIQHTQLNLLEQQPQPTFYPPVPPGSTPQPAQPGAQFTSDPVRVRTWGPLVYVYDPNKQSKKFKVNKDGYLIREEGPRGPLVGKESIENVLNGNEEETAGKLQITLENKQESYGTQLVEDMPDGAVKTTWVTTMIMVTWETERPAPAGVKEEDIDDSEDSSESSEEDSSCSSSSSSSSDTGSDDSGRKERTNKKKGKGKEKKKARAESASNPRDKSMVVRLLPSGATEVSQKDEGEKLTPYGKFWTDDDGKLMFCHSRKVGKA